MTIEDRTDTYGLIGLGNVGADLVAAAVEAGLVVHCYDVDPDARERAGSAGATVQASARDVAAVADVFVLSLPNSQIVDQVLFDEGAIEVLRRGAYLVDMSTNHPARSQALAAEGNARGVHVLDIPVSYGPEGLVGFAGGTTEALAAVRPWVDAVTVHTEHVGPHGHGQYVKLVQNVLSGVGMGVIGEVIGFAEHAGVDLEVLPEALRRTGANSRMLERTLPAMVQRRYGTSGTMALHSKDMGYALTAAESIGARMPFTAALRRVFEDVLAAGDSRWTQTALVEWYRPSAAETSAANDAE
ncbi:NAD(P)-dependent oxidoreductase [Pseudactinotalea sp. Z1732]|uniref:NAD(P)-dependent oxidoreductase n=1 Tax=Micrococcales TaxID=85006 RepID=UPI003C7AC4B1